MQLRVLTYNIHRAIGLDRQFRPDRIVRIVEDHDPDVVLFQEVDDGVPRSRELDLARELAQALGYPYFAVGHNVRLRKGRYGNATLSRHPILRERNIDLTIGARKRRGCQHTALMVPAPGGRHVLLEVFNLHLGLSARERHQQVRLLLKSRELADLPADRACLVGGDFNDWRTLLRAPFIDETGFRCATDPVSQRGLPMLTFPSFFPQGPLDTIYFRGPLKLTAVKRCRLMLSKLASDHLPVIADFDLA